MTDASTRRVRLSKEDRRERLLDAAAEIVVRDGLDAVTMEGVGAQAGVSKALPYVHFANADEVLAALFDREMAELDRRVGEALSGTESFEERIRATLSATFDLVTERGHLIGTLLSGSGRTSPLDARRIERDKVAYEFFGGLMQQEFSLPRKVANNAASLCLAAANQTIQLWVARRGSRRELTDMFVTLVFSGVEGLRATAKRQG